MVVGVIGLWHFARRRCGALLLFCGNKSTVREMNNHNVSSMRKDYKNGDDGFDIEYKDKDPLQLFSDWFSEACKDGRLYEPNSMALATSTLDGRPSVRMVLMKGYDESGFKFFTNYKSRKGNELEINPEAYLMFFWPTLHRQVRIEGRVEKLSEEESVEYFDSRPRPSQISCYASQQSQVISSRQELENLRLKTEEMFENIPVEKPKHWGGYLLRPRSLEFWQGQTDRFHDRIRFRLLNNGEIIDEGLTKATGNGWYCERLCP